MIEVEDNHLRSLAEEFVMFGGRARQKTDEVKNGG
jgi:hypothetical protein